MLNRTTCESCKEFNQNKKASNPKVLSQIIGDVKQGIEANVLVEIEQEKLEYSDPFDKITIEGPWNDIVLNYFECLACKKKFKLFANTYQGNPKNGRYKNT